MAGDNPIHEGGWRRRPGGGRCVTSWLFLLLYSDICGDVDNGQKHGEGWGRRREELRAGGGGVMVLEGYLLSLGYLFFPVETCESHYFVFTLRGLCIGALVMRNLWKILETKKRTSRTDQKPHNPHHNSWPQVLPATGVHAVAGLFLGGDRRRRLVGGGSLRVSVFRLVGFFFLSGVP